MRDQVKEMLARITDTAVTAISERQDALAQEAGRLASIVGPLAAAHRLAELAIDMFELAKDPVDG